MPNVAVLVQELFMSLFISVYNHEEEDGRYTAESFCELPDYDEVCGTMVVLQGLGKGCRGTQKRCFVRVSSE